MRFIIFTAFMIMVPFSVMADDFGPRFSQDSYKALEDPAISMQIIEPAAGDEDSADDTVEENHQQDTPEEDRDVKTEVTL